jgi:hypothetical protein
MKRTTKRKIKKVYNWILDNVVAPAIVMTLILAWFVGFFYIMLF